MSTPSCGSGEIALLKPDRKRTANVVTLGFCDLQMLDRKSFERTQSLHPEFAAAVKERSDKLVQDERQKQRRFSVSKA